MTLATAALLFAALLLFAMPSSAQADAAIVLSPGFECVVLDRDGQPVATDFGRVNVQTNSATGTATIVCAASGTTNDTGRAQLFDYENMGLLCTSQRRGAAIPRVACIDGLRTSAR